MFFFSFCCSFSSFWWSSLPVRWLQRSGASWTGTQWVTLILVSIGCFFTIMVAYVSSDLQRADQLLRFCVHQGRGCLRISQQRCCHQGSGCVSQHGMFWRGPIPNSQISLFFSRQPSDHLFFSIFQLDCCGKGDDTALFKQVAGTLCPRKSPEDFHKSQVSSKHTLRNLGIKLQGALGVLAASALCAGPVFIYFLLSPSRAVMLNSSSCSLRSSTWLVWLLWWSPSSWWVSHLSDASKQQTIAITHLSLLVQIFEMIFTMVLCCGIRNSPGVY